MENQQNTGRETGRQNRHQGRIDPYLCIAVALLSLFGIYCIANARFDPDNGTDLSALGYILANRSSTMQSIFLAISPFMIAVIVGIPLERFKSQLSRLIYLGVTVLLFLALAIGSLVNGTNNWLSLGGGRAFQPAEFAKIAVILQLARMLSASPKPMSTLKESIHIMIAVGLPAILVLAASETGSVFVILVVAVGMILFSGADIRIGLGLIATGVLLVGAFIVYAVITNSTDYRILRLLAFTAPEKYQQSGGYQILQAQKAIGSGQLTGVGTFRIGTMTQLRYVPESSTDFILASIGESFGFVGIVSILAVYAFILIRILVLGMQTEDRFGYLVNTGVFFMLLSHITVNVLMCLGLFPITGIPLPFLSYGGSNLITNMAAIGLVLNVAHSGTSQHSQNILLIQKARRKRRKKKHKPIVIYTP